MIRFVHLLSVCLFTFSPAFSQLTPEWISPSGQNMGWLLIRDNPPEFRFLLVDSSGIKIMSGVYSETPATTIAFQPYEYYNHRSSFDVSGDGFNDVFIGRFYGAISPVREGFRVVDVVTGQDLYVFDEASYSYLVLGSGYNYTGTRLADPDIDNDGLNELIVQRFQWPAVSPFTFEYLVYQTNGVATSVSQHASLRPSSAVLHQNYPNPFNPNTRIQYQLSASGPVVVEIFDINGRSIRAFQSQQQEAGLHELIWDGRDHKTMPVASGVYFYRMLTRQRAGDVLSETKKMLLMR